MSKTNVDMKKRRILQSGLGAAVFFTAIGGARAASPLCGGLTPAQTEGPFYPENTAGEDDTDLTQNGRALGQVIVVEGVVTDSQCRPVNGALVEIWQACTSGRYDHSGDPNTAPLDPNFQYWGRAVTDANGAYKFKTIVPGAYPAAPGWDRPPHIHFKIAKIGYEELITQLYFKGQKLNDRDRILRAIPALQRDRVISELVLRQGEAIPTAVFPITLKEIV
ncbi:MAG: protocatechuate 3,4-dioxygenase [Bdellovibrionota bacterium]